MKKRLLNLFLALVLVVCVLPMAASAVQYAGETCESFTGQHDWEDGYCGWCALPCEHSQDKRETVPGYAATCTKEGRTDGEKCTVCNMTLKNQETINKRGHDFTVDKGYKEDKEPTCQQTGISVIQCSRCDEKTTRTVPVVACKAINANKVDPTCTTPGKEAGKECRWCGNVMAGCTVIPATGHTYVNQGYKEGHESTCLETGIYILECSVCHDRTTQTAPVKEHSIVGYSEVPATCTKAGTTAGRKCWKCQTVLAGMEPIPATGKHVYELEEHVKLPTCTETGIDRYRCKNCTASKFEYPAKVAHTIVGYSNVPATCTKEGVTEGSKCRICNTIIWGMEPIEKLPHTPGKMTKYITRPTCQATGEAEYECTECDGSVVQEIRKLSCNIVKLEAVDPTCNDSGLTEGTKCDSCNNGATCAYCKDKLQAQTVVPALGHDHVFVKTNKAATCTKDGEGVYDCTRCGYDGVKKVLPALGHADVEEILRDVTCTRDGWKEITCSNEGCGKCITQKIEATGHTETIVPAVPATCSATGLSEGKKCSVCDEELMKQDVIRTAEHTWKTYELKPATCTEDGHNAYQECEVCQTTQNKEVYPAAHKFENYKCTVCGVRDSGCPHTNASITTTAATCSAPGKESFHCPDCGDAYQNELSQLGHTEVDHSVAATCTQRGLVLKVCGVCNRELERRTTNTIAHNYVDGICSMCGVSNVPVCHHPSNRRSTVTHASTCVENGYRETTCTACNTVISNVTLELAPHNHVKGICSVCGHKDSNRITTDFQDIFIVG